MQLMKLTQPLKRCQRQQSCGLPQPFTQGDATRKPSRSVKGFGEGSPEAVARAVAGHHDENITQIDRWGGLAAMRQHLISNFRDESGGLQRMRGICLKVKPE